MLRTALWLSMLLVLACSSDEHAPAPLRVRAAASLTEVVTDLATAFRARDVGEIETSFDASNRLARQIQRGAPADVFLCADHEWMDWIEERALVVPGTRRVVATGALVVVVARSSSLAPATLADLTAPEVERIALAGESVPAGRYADAALQHAGIEADVAERIVRAGSVRAALAWVAEGEVDAGIVYRTDAAVEPRVRIAFEIAEDAHPPIEYPAAVIAGGASADRARRFLDFCGTAEARAIFDQRGFGAPGGR